MRLGKNDPAASYDRGMAAYNQGDLAGAIRHFGRVIELDPFKPPAYYQRGLAYARSGRLEEAAADFEQAVKLGRSMPPVGSVAQSREQLVRAEYNCGLTYEKLGRNEQALEHYQAALELQPTLSDAWCNAGNVMIQVGAFEQAVQSHTRAIELDPGDYLAYFGRAIANQELSRSELVVEDLREYLRLAPSDHERIDEARRALATHEARL